MVTVRRKTQGIQEKEDKKDKLEKEKSYHWRRKEKTQNETHDVWRDITGEETVAVLMAIIFFINRKEAINFSLFYCLVSANLLRGGRCWRVW